MYSYDGLNTLLRNRGVTKTALSSALGISSRTIAKINRGEKVSHRVLDRISEYLDCPPQDLCREVSENPILQLLRDEKEAGISGGLYHELQVRMAFNSNHIEGSTLTEEQTRYIFETSTVDAGDGVPVDDILETVHHFVAVDYVIDMAEDPLTEDVIKELHLILKRDTADSRLPWFAVGDYKRRPNFVGGRKTTPPKDIPAAMSELLANYESLSPTAFDDIVAFHAEFEAIHPFQDGNGRVGRLVMLKECLRYGIAPFIIEDAKKAFYYRGLSKWPTEHGWLIDTCLNAQDTFKLLLDELEIEQGKAKQQAIQP